jgi:hypothetical protein
VEAESGPQLRKGWLLALLLKLMRGDARWRQLAPAFGINDQLRHAGLIRVRR